MKHIDRTISAIRDKYSLPEHLGSGDSLYERLDLVFEGLREALNADLNDLNSLMRISRVALVGGLTLLGICIVMILTSHMSTAAATGLLGMVSEIISIHLFGRIDKARLSIKGLLPDYRDLYSMLVLLEFGSENPGVIKDIDRALSRNE